MGAPQKSRVAAINKSTVEKYDLERKLKVKRKRGLYKRLTIFVVIFIFGVISIGTTLVKQYEVIEEKQNEEQHLEQELVRVSKEQEKLQLEVQKLADIDYIGEIARRDYSFSRPGETIFKLPAND